MKKIILPVVLLLCVFQYSSAQKIKLFEGSLEKLKGEKAYAIEFTYDNLLVGTGMPEKEYLEMKQADWESREAGKGDEFVAKWFNDRKALYEPAFVKSFEYYGYMKLNDSTARYTLIVKTKMMEGGWNVGVASHPGKIDGEMWVVESANKNNVIAKIYFLDFEGKSVTGGDFEMTSRIKSAYSVTGRWLGDFLRRKTK
jgi:hypothetical protein